MEKSSFTIERIPAVLWGGHSSSVYIFVHGSMSNKMEAECFAEEAVKRGHQVLSFDLPAHGERVHEGRPCNAENGVHDLTVIGKYAQRNWSGIGLFAVSIGAYFSLLAYADAPLTDCLFLSPVLDMERLIRNMMKYAGVTLDMLRVQKEIPTAMGETLFWDYYCYVKEHPVTKWDAPTAILYGSRDNLTERAVVDRFAERFGCALTVMQGAEHYFHTDEQLDFFGKWLVNHFDTR